MWVTKNTISEKWVLIFIPNEPKLFKDIWWTSSRKKYCATSFLSSNFDLWFHQKVVLIGPLQLSPNFPVFYQSRLKKMTKFFHLKKPHLEIMIAVTTSFPPASHPWREGSWFENHSSKMTFLNWLHSYF